jgi:hypothetical protein
VIPVNAQGLIEIKDSIYNRQFGFHEHIILAITAVMKSKKINETSKEKERLKIESSSI